jgi:hypothetical protein
MLDEQRIGPERREEQLKEEQTHDVLAGRDVTTPSTLPPQQASDNGHS